MSIKLNENILKALADPSSVKAIATNDKNGVPHITFKGSLHYNEKLGYIEHYEILESSQTNSNLVYSLWFDKQVAINVLAKDKKSYQIKGHPVKCITSGKYFESVYSSLRSNGRDIDLGAVWWIEPDEVKEETFDVRVQEDEEKYPILKHLDRLLKK
jgi:hypothetical protein